MSTILENSIDRDADSVMCPKCKGYAGGVDVTQKEIKEHQTCGRSFACCVGAFECAACGERIIARLEAPEME